MDWMGTLSKLQGGGQAAPSAPNPGFGTGPIPYAAGMIHGFGQTPDAPARAAMPSSGVSGQPPVSSTAQASSGAQRAVSGPSGAMAQSGGGQAPQNTVGAYTPQQQMQIVETIMQTLLARARSSEQQRRAAYRGARY